MKHNLFKILFGLWRTKKGHKKWTILGVFPLFNLNFKTVFKESNLTKSWKILVMILIISGKLIKYLLILKCILSVVLVSCHGRYKPSLAEKCNMYSILWHFKSFINFVTILKCWANFFKKPTWSYLHLTQFNQAFRKLIG